MMATTMARRQRSPAVLVSEREEVGLFAFAAMPLGEEPPVSVDSRWQAPERGQRRRWPLEGRWAARDSVHSSASSGYSAARATLATSDGGLEASKPAPQVVSNP